VFDLGACVGKKIGNLLPRRDGVRRQPWSMVLLHHHKLSTEDSCQKLKKITEQSVMVTTHADDSRWGKAFSSVCVCVCDCLHDNPKTAENKITKLGTGIVHQESLPIN